MKNDYQGEKAQNWRKHYGEFLKKIRQTYPDAWIVCCTTLLQHDIGWDMSISQVVNEVKSFEGLERFCIVVLLLSNKFLSNGNISVECASREILKTW